MNESIVIKFSAYLHSLTQNKRNISRFNNSEILYNSVQLLYTLQLFPRNDSKNLDLYWPKKVKWEDRWALEEVLYGGNWREPQMILRCECSIMRTYTGFLKLLLRINSKHFNNIFPSCFLSDKRLIIFSTTPLEADLQSGECTYDLRCNVSCCKEEISSTFNYASQYITANNE